MKKKKDGRKNNGGARKGAGRPEVPPSQKKETTIVKRIPQSIETEVDKLTKEANKLWELRKQLASKEAELKEMREAYKILKSMTLSIAAHPDCVKGSEFFDLVSISEKVIESILSKQEGK